LPSLATQAKQPEGRETGLASLPFLSCLWQTNKASNGKRLWQGGMQT